jgi:glycosyltransferase involved in cell wall biosynthesis
MVTNLNRAEGTPAIEAPRTGGPRVCLAALNFPPVYAGPGVRFSRYLPHFADLGVDVEVFTGTPDRARAVASDIPNTWAHLAHGALLPGETSGPAEVHRVRLPDEGERKRSYVFSRKLAEHCQNYGETGRLVHLLNAGLPSIPALVRLRRHGIASLFTSTMVPQFSGPAIKKAAARRLFRAPLNLMSCVVVSTGVMRRQLEDIGVRTTIRIIPNGVDTDRFKPLPDGDKQRLRGELGLDPTAPLVVFVGPTVARKGIDLLFEAWQSIARRQPDAHLAVVGPRLRLHADDVGFQERLASLLEASGAGDRVHFTGFVENVEDYLRAGDVFVFPSRREGMPNVVPEAMATGLPVVMTPFIGLPAEFGESGRHYLKTDFKPGELADAISLLLSDRKRRHELGAAARRWTEENLSLDRSIEKYVDLYREFSGPPS